MEDFLASLELCEEIIESNNMFRKQVAEQITQHLSRSIVSEYENGGRLWWVVPAREQVNWIKEGF